MITPPLWLILAALVAVASAALLVRELLRPLLAQNDEAVGALVTVAMTSTLVVLVWLAAGR